MLTVTTSNVLDLFFTTKSTLVNKVEIIPGISDHEDVFIESSLKPMKVKIGLSSDPFAMVLAAQHH